MINSGKKTSFLAIFIISLTLLTIVAISSLLLPISAAGTIDLFIDADSWIPVGKTFSVTVRAEATVKSIVNLEIYYNSADVECISVVSSNDSCIINDDGSTIMIVTMAAYTHTFTCTFKMKTANASVFKVQVIECGSEDGIELPKPSLQTTVTGYIPTPVPTQTPTPTPTSTQSSVTQQPTPTPTPTQTPSYTPFNPTADPSATPANPDEFLDNGEIRYIADDFEENTVIIPEGFEKRSVKYLDANIFGAQNSSGVSLVYTTDVLGQNGKFYIYIEKQNSLLPYLEIPYGNNNYVFTKFSEIPSSLQETDFELTEKKIPAYKTTNQTYKDFIVLYGFKVGGELSYYLYDTVEGTLQRCVEPDILNSFHESWNDENNNGNNETPPTQTPAQTTNKPTTTPLDEKDNFKIDKKTILWVIIIVCAIALIIATITIIVRSKKIANNFEDDGDDEYYNEEEFMSVQPTPAPVPEETVMEPKEETPIQDIPELEDDEDEILQLGND